MRNDDEQRPDVRPRLVVSNCLGLAACRYDGGRVGCEVVFRLAAEVDLVPICPEVGIGLGVPRDPIVVLAEGAAGRRLVQLRTGRDVTDRMHAFSERFLDRIGSVDGFVLKSGSPSCGLGSAKVLDLADDENRVVREDGLFAAAARERFRGLVLVDESAWDDAGQRDDFLCRLFALARVRALEAADPRRRDLARFHARHEFLLMAHDEPISGPIGAQEADGGLSVARRALSRPASTAGHAKALSHAFDGLSDTIGTAERSRFRAGLEELKAGDTPPFVLRTMLRGWAERVGDEGLLGQYYLDPYPRPLAPTGAAG